MTRSFCWRCGEDCGRSPGWRWHYWSLSPGSAATAIARAHALLVIGVTDRRRSVGVSVYGGKRRFFEDRSRTRLRSVRESSSRPLGVFSLQYCGRFSSSGSLARNGGGEGKDFEPPTQLPVYCTEVQCLRPLSHLSVRSPVRHLSLLSPRHQYWGQLRQLADASSDSARVHPGGRNLRRHLLAVVYILGEIGAVAMEKHDHDRRALGVEAWRNV